MFNMSGFFLFFMLLAIAGLGVWIWALVDAISVPNDSDYKTGTKLIWVLVIVFAQFIGAIVYLAVGRPDKARPPVASPPTEGAPPPGSMPSPPPPPVG